MNAARATISKALALALVSKWGFKGRPLRYWMKPSSCCTHAMVRGLEKMHIAFCSVFLRDGPTLCRCRRDVRTTAVRMAWPMTADNQRKWLIRIH
jgi:hypothetical protein